MKAARVASTKAIPIWVEECISSPREGVLNFLKELCNLGNAPYAHIRIRSRSGFFFTLVESIGPYKTIGWQRRFHLIDDKNTQSLTYQFIDYKVSPDCQALKDKFRSDLGSYQYLDSLAYGFWIPLKIRDIELGYVTLSWTKGRRQRSRAIKVENYIKLFSDYLPLVHQACRNILTENYLTGLWSDTALILSATDEHDCYDKLGEACLKFWGEDVTVYIGKVANDNASFDVVTVAGRRAEEAKKNIKTHNIPINKGIFGYLYRTEAPVLSYSISKDTRFRYHSMREDGIGQGSVIAARITDAAYQNPFAFITVEHEQDNYFDTDDIRYITGITRIGYENITAHRNDVEKRSRDFDALFTQVSHDVVEPLQALVADAEVLRYETTEASNHLYSSVNIDKYLSDTLLRATNFLDEALNLNKIMWGHLDSGIDGRATKIKDGVIRLYPLLNALVDTWRSRAEAQGIEIKSLFDSLRNVRVSCDEAALKSALGHVMGNAVKYSFWGHKKYRDSIPKHGRYISVVGRVKLGKAVIEVQNYGIGILDSEIKFITDKYYRGKLATHEGRVGTGRGLWSVKTFLESVGGRLNITSIQQSSDILGPYSTTVFLYLPIKKIEEN